MTYEVSSATCSGIRLRCLIRGLRASNPFTIINHTRMATATYLLPSLRTRTKVFCAVDSFPRRNAGGRGVAGYGWIWGWTLQLSLPISERSPSDSCACRFPCRAVWLRFWPPMLLWLQPADASRRGCGHGRP